MATLFQMAQTDPSDAPRVPVTVLTGFLGSGKTTLLNRLLHMPDMAGVAVVINEFGAVGLDHDLVEQSQESTVLLANGCICCTIRSDLIDAFDRLADSQAMRAGMLRHVVLETTGLAVPAPILHTLMGDMRIARHWRLAGVACTVDAVNGMGTLDRHREALKQVAVADLLLVTKTDLVDPTSMTPIVERVRSINPVAEICSTPQEILPRLHKLLQQSPAIAREIADPDYQPFSFRPVMQGGDHSHTHDEGIQAYVIVRDDPLPREGFFAWLEMVASMRGDDLLRVKGLVCLDDKLDCPVVIHGVQHVFHPPVELSQWPSDDHRTRIVFITRGVEVSALDETLNVLARRRRRTAAPAPPTSAAFTDGQR